MSESDKQGRGSGFTRRGAIVTASACFAMMSQRAEAADTVVAAGTGLPGAKPVYSMDSDTKDILEYTGIHAGKGTGRIKRFPFDGATAPANFIIYDLPPGASEGVHVHFLDNHNREGSFDEYYYILAGQGQMEIDGQIVEVAQGDHVHTPLEVSHGIENTHPTDRLKVFLTFIKRGA